MFRSWLNIQKSVSNIQHKDIKFKFSSIPFPPKRDSRPTALPSVFQFLNINPQVRSGSKFTHSHIITFSKQNMYILPTLKPVQPQSSYIFTHFLSIAKYALLNHILCIHTYVSSSTFSHSRDTKLFQDRSP